MTASSTALPALVLNKSKSFFHYDFLHTPHESDTKRHVFFSALWRSAVVAVRVIVAGFSFIKPASANFAQPQKKQQQQRHKKRQYYFATVASQSLLPLLFLLLAVLVPLTLPLPATLASCCLA